MGRRFAELAFTPLVKEQQEKHGSRHLYERAERSDNAGDRLGDYEREFIGDSDGFYMASTGETGWPYIQYRGGEKGFLRILDDKTLASPTCAATSNTSAPETSSTTIVSPSSSWTTRTSSVSRFLAALKFTKETIPRRDSCRG